MSGRRSARKLTGSARDPHVIAARTASATAVVVRDMPPAEALARSVHLRPLCGAGGGGGAGAGAGAGTSVFAEASDSAAAVTSAVSARVHASLSSSAHLLRSAEALHKHDAGSSGNSEAAAGAGTGPVHDVAAVAAGRDIVAEAVALDDEDEGVEASERGGRRVGLKRRALPQPLAERAAPGELPRGDLGPPARRPRGGVNAGRDTSDLPPGEEAGLFYAGKAPDLYD